MLPPANVNEVDPLRSIRFIAATSLHDLADEPRDGTLAHATPDQRTSAVDEIADFTGVVGQQTAKRAMEIAAAGAHVV